MFDRKLSRDNEAVHVLNRLTFGPRASNLDEVRRAGVEKWTEQQLHPERIPQTPVLEAKLKPLSTLQMASWQINESARLPPLSAQLPAAPKGVPRDLLMKLVEASVPERRVILDGLPKDVRSYALAVFSRSLFEGMPDILAESDKLRPPVPKQPQQAASSELIASKLYRAVYSARQLEEVLVDFWLNHFNVYVGKGVVRTLLTSYERDAIRPHVFGRFGDMLLATARHPAMLFYLDNWLSQDPNGGAAPGPTGSTVRPLGLNENYGRELLELHTLGVDGGYTQEDVIAVARCFTGWTIFDPNGYAEFQFNPAMHDRGEKVVLRRTLERAGGESDGLTVIEMLSRHPSTAWFVSRKLAQRFVADDPPRTLVERMANTFTRTNGDLRAVTETALLSREFLSEGAWRSKIKSPLELVVSSLRALDAEVTDTTEVAQSIAELGQPLYGNSEPTGYGNTSEGWASSAGLLGRIHFASALANGQTPGVRVDADLFAPGTTLRAAGELFGASAATIASMEKEVASTSPAPAVAALLLASPDFQKK